MYTSYAWCVMLFVSAFGAAPLVFEDDPLVQKVIDIISDVDGYLFAMNLTEIKIPDIDYPYYPVKLKNGGFNDISTVTVLDGTSVQKSQIENSTLYIFNMNLGLRELQFHYDYQVDSPKFNRSGDFTLAVMENAAEFTGYAFVDGDSCKATLGSFNVTNLGLYVIFVEPNNIPKINELSKEILDFVVPYIPTLINQVLQETLQSLHMQEKISKITCHNIATLYFM